MAAASGGASSKDVKAGGAFVEVSIRDKTTAVFAKISERATYLGKVLAGIGGGIVGLSLPFFKGGVERAVEIDRLSTSLGIASEEMQRLKYAADLTGLSIDQIRADPDKFKDLLADAPIMDQQTIQDSVAANRALKKSLIEIQTALAPLVSLVAGGLKFVSILISNNEAIVYGIALVGGALVGLGAVLSVVFAKWFIIPAVIAGAIVAFVKFTDAGKRMQEEFGGTINGIIESIKSGDIESAWGYLTAGIEFGWKKLILNLKMLWMSFSSWLKSNLVELEAGADVILNDIAAWAIRNDPTGLLKDGLDDQAINQGRADIRDEIVNRNRDEQVRIKRERDQALRDAQKELDAARAAFNKKNQDLNEKIKGDKPGHQPDTAPTIAAVRGAFRLGANASQQFGEGTNLVKKQIEVAEKQLEKLDEAVEAIVALGKGLAFK